MFSCRIYIHDKLNYQAYQMTDKNLIDKARNSLPRALINAKGKDEDRIVYVIAYELVCLMESDLKRILDLLGT